MWFFVVTSFHSFFAASLVLSAVFSTSLVLAQSSTTSSSATFTKVAPPAISSALLGDPNDLCYVADETRRYMQQGHAYDPNAIHAGKIAGAQIPVARVEQTLAFICQVVREDQAAKHASRLADAKFIQQHFEFIRWTPDRKAASALAKNKPLLQNLPAEQILKTKYYVRMADAAGTKSASHPHALYGLPFDEAHLDLASADALGKKITRFQYGKQQILQGVLDANAGKPAKAPALLWLSRDDLEGALLQGTAVVGQAPNYRYFNVHRTNGIPYDRRVTPEQQQRYWYFKEVKSVLGYGKDADYKIPIKPEVTVAGDIAQFGLGKLFLLGTTEHGKMQYRLTILADTGGAFANNLFQLDWLSGYYRDNAAYYAANRHRGDYSDAWILVKK